MSTATLASPAVTAFAAAVRDALSDLPDDEVDELTDGLEADLTEQLADGDTERAALGDPFAYAEELRTAAGLPARVSRHGFGAELSALRSVPAGAVRDLRAFVSRSPALGRLIAFLVSLRPVWWVLRALLVTALATILLGRAPINGFSVAIGIIVLIVSVQFGRGRWLPFVWMRALLLAANVVLAIALPFVIVSWATELNNATYAQTYAESYPDQSGTGLTLDGNPVSNVFAYDAQGNPLSDVQLFDQDGKPLNLVGDPTSTTNQDFYPGIIVPNQSVSGRLGWNVYPLAHVSAGDLNDDGSIKQSAIPTPAVPPFATTKPLAGSSAELTPSPIPTASSPSATPTPAP